MKNHKIPFDLDRRKTGFFFKRDRRSFFRRVFSKSGSDRRLNQVVRKLLPFSVLAALVTACAPVQFEKNKSCGQFGNQECEVVVGELRRFDNSITVGLPQADILFVNDNSGSMSVEQAKMGEKFPSLINSLSGIDYHIGVITTDVSDSPGNSAKEANGYGDFQDGNLLEFSAGLRVLTSSVSGITDMFRSTIQRPETLACEKSDFLASSCPSPDERGIFAALKAVEKNDADFFRPESHLALVILSDENVRSSGGDIPGYGLETNDQPETLMAKVKEVFGEAKSFSAHSIIIEPGDSQCLSTQNSQTRVRGFEGGLYAKLSELTGGTTGSICADDYGSEMGSIGAKIVDRTNSMPLACKPVENDVAVIFTPAIDDLDVSVNPEELRVKFSREVPPGTTVRLIYDCPPL